MGVEEATHMSEGAAHAAPEAVKGIAIHLAPDVVTHVGTLPITSTLITSWVTVLTLIVIAVLVRKQLALIPGRIQVIFEAIVGGGYDYVKETLESEVLAKRYFPIIATIFFFILAANWIGLLPGVTSIGYWTQYHGSEKLVPFFYPVNTDLNVTIALALIAMATVQMAGILALGAWKYGGKFINFHSVLGFFIGIVELIGEIARVISFAFRLFGNIFAGKTLILVTVFFVPLVMPVPIMAFEFFVGFIQALVFAILTLLFIKLAVAEPH
jgi:F-type H+-transporting ATPase subunit a